MAKDNIFEQDLQLQGIAKILNLRLDVLASISDEPIVNKQGGLYFDSDEESLRVNVDGTNWYSSVLFNGASDDVATLPVFMADELNKVEKFMNPSTGPQLVYLDRTSEVKLIEKINFTHFLDSAIYTADYRDIAAGETLLPTAGAVYDYVNATIVGSGGLLDDYLPLDGGEMVGNILMGSTYRINFFNTDHYIYGVDSDQLVINGKTRIFLNVNNGSRVVIANSLLYAAVTTNTYDIGSLLNKFKDGYFGTTVFTPKLSGNGALLTIVGGAYDDTKIEIGGDQVMFYDHIVTSGLGTKDIGDGTNRWRYGYFNYVSAFRLYLNSTTDYITEIATAVDLALPNNTTIVTEQGIAELFATIETITGATITNMETVGMVTRFSGSNPKNYYLAGDNTWNSLVWLVSDTTLGLNSSLGITDFEFLAATTVAFGVNGRYSQLTYLDDGNMTLYLGEIGSSLLTDHTYPIEIIGAMRTTSSILIGGTLSTNAVVTLSASTISAVPVLSISTAIDCEGISTDGTNIWKLLDTVTGTSITPSDLLVVTINGVYYKIVAQEFTPAP